MIELQQLQAFIAVANCGSFSTAAEQVHITQPAVSKRIAALERHLGKTLFNRLGREIKLTEAGHCLLKQAKPLMTQVQSLETSIKNLNDTVEGILSLGISHHIGLHRLPSVLKAFCQIYPNVELDIDFIDSEQAYDSVISGKMEIGVVTLPITPQRLVTAQPVWSDELVFVAHTDHPLLQIKQPTLQHLIQYPCILPNHNTFTRQVIEQPFKQAADQLTVAIETNYLETNRMLISIGLGWGVLPRIMCDDSIEILPMNNLRLHRPLGYVINPKRQLSNAGKAMIALLDSVAR